MLTAGRPHLLEEALYSFLNLEDSQDSELIIINDYPHQKLIFEHPRVRIVNSPELFPSIGEKDIFAHDLCQGDIILVFDDDDIALPHHLKNIEKYMGDNDLLHWGNGGFYNEEPGGIKLDKPLVQFTQLGNSGIVYTKKAYLEVGKSPVMNEGGDMILVHSLKALREKYLYAMPENKDISWLYRWSTPTSSTGVGCYHQSGMGNWEPGRDDVRIRNFNYLENLRYSGMLPTGDIKLVPKWKHNYIELVKSYL